MTKLALFFALLGTAVSARSAEPPAAVTASMTCTPFKWAKVGEHERGAILVPVTLDGHSFEFQLDTGADVSFLPADAAVAAGLMEEGAGGARIADVRIGGASVGPRWMLTRGSTGTIGLDMLVGYTTVIDYPAQRFCVTPTADFPYAIYKSTKWTDAVLRHGKLFVPVAIGGERRGDFFFDTGASLFPLSVDPADWKALTGLDDPNAGDTRISGSAWGAKVELIGARSRQPVAIASLPPTAVDVFHRTGAEGRFADYPFPAAGLIGNAGLWDRTIVLWIGSSPRFGIVEAEPSTK